MSVGSESLSAALVELDAALGAGLTIGLSGASGAGKTTFFEYMNRCARARPHIEGVREWMRDAAIADYNSLDSVDIAQLHLHLLRRYQRANANVFDRTPVDLFRVASRLSKHLDLATLAQECRELAQRVDTFVLFPAYAPYLIDDGAREMEPEVQQEAYARTLTLARDWGFADRVIVFVHELSLDENVQRVVSAWRARGGGQAGEAAPGPAET